MRTLHVGIWGGRSPVELPGQPSFPRLAMWWPNHSTQSAAARARYDVVGMQNYDSDHIAELRAANPNIVLLGSHDAHNIPLNWSTYDDSAGLNDELRTTSLDWVLCQLGSTLASPATNSTTSFTVQSGHGSRFVAGDIIILGSGASAEMLNVSSVSSDTVNVTARGIPITASSHAAGTFIAAAVQRNTGAANVVFDLTDDCPLRDVGYGSERFSDWNARRGVNAYEGADWDGLIVDNGVRASTAMLASIDQNRDGVADNTTTFETTWNDAQCAYSAKLRTAIGGVAILVTNGGLSHTDHVAYDDLNGCLFEGKPDNSGLWDMATWQQWFLSRTGNAWEKAYLQWEANGRTPRYNWVETYLDSDSSLVDRIDFAAGYAQGTETVHIDGVGTTFAAGQMVLVGDGWLTVESATTLSGGEQDVTFTTGIPRAVIDNEYVLRVGSSELQLMRYGLCSALLGDGLFSAESSTDQHGTGGLMWFDEFDNAGAGKGYLGEASGAYSPIGTNCYVRYFENGCVLVNPDDTSSRTVTHDLLSGGPYHRISGVVDPTTNNGETVDAGHPVVLAARDGIVLLK